MNIAFIGLGNMGSSMAQNLLQAGENVFGYDLSEKALQHFAAGGGVVCASPQAAARQADIVITMLPAAKHVREVYLGEEGVLAVLQAGSLCIDCSTIDPQTIKDIAAQAQQQGIQVCDAPVSGGTIGAKAGTLTFMVGADAQTYAAAQPVLALMGKNTVSCGAVGAGQSGRLAEPEPWLFRRDRRSCRRTGHARIQPCPGRAPRQFGSGIPDLAGGGAGPVAHRQLWQGTPAGDLFG